MSRETFFDKKQNLNRFVLIKLKRVGRSRGLIQFLRLLLQIQISGFLAWKKKLFRYQVTGSIDESRERRKKGRKEGGKEGSVVDVNRSSYVTALDALSSFPTLGPFRCQPSQRKKFNF